MSRDPAGAHRAPFRLVANDADVLAVWPLGLTIPLGWSAIGFAGDLTACAELSRRILDRTPGSPVARTSMLQGVFHTAVERWADRFVLHTATDSYTYLQLDQATRALTHGLRKADVAPQETVAVRTVSWFGRLAALTGLSVHGALPVAATAPTRVVLHEDGSRVVVRAAAGPHRSWPGWHAGAYTVGLVVDDVATYEIVPVTDSGITAMLTTRAARHVEAEDRTAWDSSASSWRHLFEAWSTFTAGGCLVRSSDGRYEPTVVVSGSAADFPHSARLVVVDGVLDTDRRRLLDARGADVVEVWSAAGVGGIAAERTESGSWYPVFPNSTYVLDGSLAAVPPGRAGDLYVGGAALGGGVPGRADRTLLRWLPDPFAGDGSRMLATGHKAVPVSVDGHCATALEIHNPPTR